MAPGDRTVMVETELQHTAKLRPCDELERTFLRECESGKRDTVGILSDFHPHRRRIGRGDLSRSQHRILTEYLAVHFRDEEILVAFVLPPDLPEFDGLHCHRVPS
jgi:hypothetical protein